MSVVINGTLGISGPNSPDGGLGPSASVSDLDALKALVARPDCVLVKNGRAAGLWQWDSDSAETPDDGIIVQCGISTGRYKRVFAGEINVHWYGALGDNNSNGIADTAAWTAALTAGNIACSPGKTYSLSNVTIPSGRQVNLNGASLTPAVGADYAIKLTGYGTRISNGYISDNNSRTVRHTTATSGVSAGQKSITVANATGFIVNNIIFVTTDSETLTSYIDTVVGNTITLKDGLPDDMPNGAHVVSCRGVMILDELTYGQVSDIIFANLPLALELRSIGGITGCGKNAITNIRIDFPQLCGIALLGDTFDNDFSNIQCWGGFWYIGPTPTIKKACGFYLDARPHTIAIFGANTWTACRSLGGHYGAILRRSEMGLWSNCNLDANDYWGMWLDDGAHKNIFTKWIGANGSAGGGGVKTTGTNTIENWFPCLHSRFNGPSQVGPDINVGVNNTVYVNDSNWGESRVWTGSGRIIFNQAVVTGSAGEMISAEVAPGVPIGLTSEITANVVSIALTPGDWDVWACIQFTGFADTTVDWCAGAIELTNNSLTDNQTGTASMPFMGLTPFSSTNHFGFAIPVRRVVISGNQTQYLNAYAKFGTNAMSAYGGIFARRIR